MNHSLSKVQLITTAIRILLGSLFVSAIIATLICSYLQHVNLAVIFTCFSLGSIHGIYSIIRVYKGIGFARYNAKVVKIDID